VVRQDKVVQIVEPETGWRSSRSRGRECSAVSVGQHDLVSVNELARELRAGAPIVPATQAVSRAAFDDAPAIIARSTDGVTHSFR
jgi:hypothetical protein